MGNEKQCMKIQCEIPKDVFKKPLPLTIPNKRIKTEVLDEETYLNEIGKIIQRDFYPDLEKLKAQNAYLEAIENNDMTKLHEIYSKYSINRNLPVNSCSSPATFETPVFEKIESGTPVLKKTNSESSLKNDSQEAEKNETSDDQEKIQKDKSLDEFLSIHTSEDNQNFEELVLKSEIKHREKYPWLFKEEYAKLEAPGQTCNEQLKLRDSIWSYKNNNYIMCVPDGIELSREQRLEMLRNKRKISHANTRFNQSIFSNKQNKDVLQSLGQFQNRGLEKKIGVDGKELSFSETPKVNGYNFVKTPSPLPGMNESPLMTWGQIEGTPFRLDGSDTPVIHSAGPSFKIAEPTIREKLAHALAEKTCEKNKDKKLRFLKITKT